MLPIRRCFLRDALEMRDLPACQDRSDAEEQAGNESRESRRLREYSIPNRTANRIAAKIREARPAKLGRARRWKVN